MVILFLRRRYLVVSTSLKAWPDRRRKPSPEKSTAFSCSLTHFPFRHSYGRGHQDTCRTHPPHSCRSTHESVSASGALRRGSVADAVAGAGVEAEELSADAIVLEAGAGAPGRTSDKLYVCIIIFSHRKQNGEQTNSPVFSALCIQRQQLSREHPGQGLLLVGAVVHARGSLTAVKRAKVVSIQN